MDDTYIIEIMPEARKSIRERAVYIQEQGNPFAAIAYASGVYAYISKYLTYNPELFKVWYSSAQSIRLAFYKKTTVIAYTVDNKNMRVTVLNVYHTRQNYTQKFSRDVQRF